MQAFPEPAEPIAVVGIGADGWDGVGAAARRAVQSSDVVFGSARQLALTAPGQSRGQRRQPWPSPLLPALPGLFAAESESRICVVASGDPMFFGIGVTLARIFGPQRLRVFPQASSASLACARLGWAVAETAVLSAVGRPLHTVLPGIVAGARLLVLSNDQHTAAELAKLLVSNGFGQSRLTVLEQLGGPREDRHSGIAENWGHPAGDVLNIIAVECIANAGTPRLTRFPGLPDEVFGGTGQFTKAEVRALTLAALAPARGELLWDVGAGSGSIAIEWCRADPGCRAVAFESREARAQALPKMAASLGVSAITLLGSAPAAFDDAPAPDAVFVGGGVSQPGLLNDCWNRLRPGGRMVANAVTLAGESALVQWTRESGGFLRKFQIYRAEDVGTMTMWRPMTPVTQWVGAK
ncbi:MAG: precorrin-6y C5,15-methyltransferase (decarboxylating) subunit CbiE [Mycobacteriaceae bacterium]|nr:precorrin-6y C5,15-methyltransferase (decarboxylating) subunit CbiE [Mycobacteriaceae bacterium]